MFIAAITGSPRKDRESEKMASKALFELEKLGYKTTLIKVSETPILPCRHCNHCKEHKICVDESTNKVNAILEQSDGILISSPVYCRNTNKNPI